MNKDYLIQMLEESEEEEVYIMVDDTLHEFDVENIPETFDGFDTAYPAALAFKAKEG